MLENGRLPILGRPSLSIIKLPILKSNDTTLLEVKNQNTVPYVTDYFYKKKLTDCDFSMKKILLTFDTFNYVKEKDTSDIFEDIVTIDYQNGIFNKRKNTDMLNVAKISFELPLHHDFMNENFWFNNTLKIPTRHFNKDNKLMYYVIKNAILSEASFNITLNANNRCSVTLYVLDIGVVFEDYDINDWRNFYFTPTCSTYTDDNNNILKIKKISYSKSSTVKFSILEDAAQDSYIYIYDIKSYDNIVKRPGFINISKPVTYDVNLDYCATQTFYTEKADITFLDFDYDRNLKNKYSVNITPKNTAYKTINLTVYNDNITKSEDNSYSIDGTGVLRWL